MNELEIYKKALEKISQYGIKPTGETELQRIKRLKSIADKALYIVSVYDLQMVKSSSEKLTQCMIGRDAECNHPNCPVTDEDAENGIYCTLPLFDYRQ